MMKRNKKVREQVKERKKDFEVDKIYYNFTEVLALLHFGFSLYL